jgi:hypothetical protein
MGFGCPEFPDPWQDQWPNRTCRRKSDAVWRERLLLNQCLFTESMHRCSKSWKDWKMKKLVSAVLAASMAFGSTAAFAGGPVVVVEEGQPEVVADSPRSGWIVPVVVGLIVICALACGNDDDEPVLEE